MNSNSPFAGKPQEDWRKITQDLLTHYPLSAKDMVDASFESWKGIFDTGIGTQGFKIGRDIFPSPQIMGFLLHELIPLNLHAKYPSQWKKDIQVSEKDLLYVPDVKYSMEIKTSSHRNKIFGNRSYAQPAQSTKKDKSGYYLAINFEKFTKTRNDPRIRLIRFGWLDHTDWIGQTAATGQQAHLRPESESNKLLALFSV